MLIVIARDAAVSSVLDEIAQTFGTSVDIDSVYLVGGAARAMVMGTSTQDIDLVFENRDAEKGAGLLASRWGVEVAKIGNPTRAYQVRKDGATLEVECIDMDDGSDSIAGDMGRRDFTLNSFAIPLADAQRAAATGVLYTGRIVDPFDGVNDARNGILRAVSRTAMVTDPSRIFRCIRFMAVFGLKVEADTMDLLLDPANRERIKRNCKPDSTWTQLVKILKSNNAAQALQFFDHIGLFHTAFPGLAAEGAKEQVMDAARWVDACSATTSDGMSASERWAREQAREFALLSSDQMLIVRLAALATGFDNPEKRLREMRVPQKIARAAIKVFKGHSAAESDNAWEVHDAVGAENVEMACWFAMTQSFNRGETPRFDQLNAAIRWQEPALPNGGEIARACNLSGPQIGAMIDRIREAVRTGTIAEDHESALAFAQANAEQVRTTVSVSSRRQRA